MRLQFLAIGCVTRGGRVFQIEVARVAEQRVAVVIVEPEPDPVRAKIVVVVRGRVLPDEPVIRFDRAEQVDPALPRRIDRRQVDTSGCRWRASAASGSAKTSVSGG
ncbi:hypothetical protein WL26_27960 [Burkholderia cepacia]|nr:hypothetical protein WL26_27960 [Burkholderia cepacia]